MPEIKPPRVAIYVRQSVAEPQGIEQQIAACRTRIAAEGWHEVSVYDDDGTSATKPREAGTAWARMLAEYDAGGIDLIIAAKTARLLRSITDVVELTRPKRSVRVVTLDGVDTGSAMGSLVLAILVAVAQGEIQEKEDRAEPYRAARREDKHPAPGKPPYGYRHVPKPHPIDTRTEHWKVVPEEAVIVERIFRDFNNGTALWDIRAVLNEEGVRTRAGKPWGISTLRRMLINPAYARFLVPKGTARNGGNELVELRHCVPEGSWQGLVSEADLIAARSILLHEDRLKGPGSTSRRWLLPGLAFCSVCGGHIRSAKNRHLRGYRCATGHFHREADPIDTFVTREALAVIMRANPRAVDEDTAELIAVTRTALAASRAKSADLFDLWERGALESDEFERGRVKLRSEIDRLEAELRELKRRSPVIEAITADDLEAHWNALPLSRQRALLSALIAEIEIMPVGNGVKVRTHEKAAQTVHIKWRASTRRMSFATREITTRGNLPTVAEATIAALMSS